MNNCNMIKDLLPLYADEVCSDESRKAVEEHLKECPDCKAELEKLRRHVAVSPQKDAEVLRRIKKRLRIEKIATGLICAAALIFTALAAMVYLINTDKSMDIERYDIPNSVYVTEENGILRFCVKGGAASFDSLVPTLSDSDGHHLLYDDGYEKDKRNGMGYTLKQRKISGLSYIDYGNEAPFSYEIGTVDKMKEKNIEKIF